MYRYLWSTPTPLRPPRATARRAGPNAVRTGAFPMTRKGGASRASALRRVAPSGRIRARVRARASRAAARWRDSSRPSPCSRAIPVYGMMDAQNRNTRYGKTRPGIYRYTADRRRRAPPPPALRRCGDVLVAPEAAAPALRHCAAQCASTVGP